MSSSVLLRLGGLPLLVGGLASAVIVAIHPHEITDPMNGPIHVGLFLSVVLVLLGWPAVLARQAGQIGILGPVGWACVFLALAFDDLTHSVVELGVAPVLASDPSTRPLLADDSWAATALFQGPYGLLLTLAAALVLLVFPNGRLPGPRWRPMAWGAAIGFLLVGLAGALMPGPLNNIPSAANPLGWAAMAGPTSTICDLGGPFMLLTLAAGVVALAGRFRRSRGVERQQLKWLAYAASFAPLAAINSFIRLFGSWSELTMWLVFYAIPLAIGVAILRYQLYDIDLLINRTLVYGVLSAGVIGVYVAVVSYLGALFRTDDSFLISIVATGAVAVLFQPLRERLQRAVNHLLYGQRDEPYQALAHLGQRLEATLETEAVLPAIAEGVALALRLPYAAVALKQGGQLTLAATYGKPVTEVEHLPLVYQAEPVGELVLAPRAPGDAFSGADQRLLRDLARQVGVAVHAVRLTADLRASLQELRRSREQLVLAQEEERQRLRATSTTGWARRWRVCACAWRRAWTWPRAGLPTWRRSSSGWTVSWAKPRPTSAGWCTRCVRPCSTRWAWSRPWSSTRNDSAGRPVRRSW